MLFPTSERSSKLTAQKMLLVAQKTTNIIFITTFCILLNLKKNTRSGIASFYPDSIYQNLDSLLSLLALSFQPISRREAVVARDGMQCEEQLRIIEITSWA